MKNILRDGELFKVDTTTVYRDSKGEAYATPLMAAHSTVQGKLYDIIVADGELMQAMDSGSYFEVADKLIANHQRILPLLQAFDNEWRCAQQRERA